MPSAMGNKGEPPEMSEARLLAPWYVTGKIDAAEAKELEELAREDEEFAELLAEMKREAHAAVTVNEALGSPPAAVWDRLERSIEQEKRVRSRNQFAGFVGAARTFASSFLEGFTKPQWQAVAAAAVAICVIQAGAIAYLAQSDRAPAKYVTASGPKTDIHAKPAAFIASFAPDATIGEISNILDASGVIIVDGPNSDMLYHLGLRDDNIVKDEAFKKLRSSAVVKLILPQK